MTAISVNYFGNNITKPFYYFEGGGGNKEIVNDFQFNCVRKIIT